MMQVQPWVRLHRVCAPSLSGKHFFPQGQRSTPNYRSLVIRGCSSGNSKRNMPWLLVGLGNPGSKFQGTRHNVGFEMLDAIAQAEGISLQTIQHKALLGKDPRSSKPGMWSSTLVEVYKTPFAQAKERIADYAGYIGGTPVLLAKPQTYMNLSGESVGPIAAYYKIPEERVLAIYDDLDLDFAVMRMLPKGGHGGHNGMKSLIQHFRGSRDFPRLRIGIGRPTGSMDPKAYVLQRFSSVEREELNVALQRGVEGVRLLTAEGLEKAVSTWNSYQKSRLGS